MWIAIANGIGTRQGVGGGPGPTPPPYTPPLDSITAAVAYSVRKLNSTYSGDCMLVRRVSDGATQGIGFDNNGLIDVNALATFSGGSELTVKVWYDQAGGGFDLEQPNDAYLPTIYDGAAVTTSTSGKPCVRIVRVATAGPGEWLKTDPVSLSTAGDMDVFLVLDGSTAVGGDRYFWDSSDGPTTSGARFGTLYPVSTYAANGQGVGLTTAVQKASSPVPNNLQFIHNTRFHSNLEIYGNGLEFGSVVGTNTSRTDPYNVGLGARVTGAEGYNTFDISEIIHLPSYGVSNNESINLNINDYYQFTNLPYYSSGLLADYSGAAVAYSVRKLSNTAIKALRVRQTIPPFDELDIGFTPAGDLDETAITTFGAGNPLTVSRWYDQSGNSRHAAQNTPGNQPQIYNGTAVITENGKPALECLSPKHFTLSSGATQPFTQHVVCNPGTASSQFAYGETLMLRYDVTGTTKYHDGSWKTPSPTFTSASGDQNHNMLFYYGATTGYAIQNQSSHQQEASVAFTSLRSPTTSLGGKLTSGGVAALQEFIIWNNDQYSNRSNIETDTNDYFSIYTP